MLNKKILVAVFAGLILFIGVSTIVRQCTPSPYKEIVKEDVKARKAWEKSDLEKTRIIDSLKAVNIVKEQEIAKKEKEAVKLEQSLAVTSGKLKFYIKEADKGRKPDTTCFSTEVWDSIKVQTDSLIFTVGQYQTKVDSLKEDYKNLLSNKDKEITNRVELYSELKNAYNQSYKSEQLLYKENQKLTRKNKRGFNVSVSGGYGISYDLKPKPFIGITAGKTLFEF